jgi:hypothetical protein
MWVSLQVDRLDAQQTVVDNIRPNPRHATGLQQEKVAKRQFPRCALGSFFYILAAGSPRAS